MGTLLTQTCGENRIDGLYASIGRVATLKPVFTNTVHGTPPERRPDDFDDGFKSRLPAVCLDEAHRGPFFGSAKDAPLQPSQASQFAWPTTFDDGDSADHFARE